MGVDVIDLDDLKRHALAIRPSLVDLTERLCRIPAPSYDELERARLMAAEFAHRGLKAEIDEIGNVYARRPGSGGKRSVMFLGHTDTVFPKETPLSVRRDGGRLYGPGIGDNCLGAAALIGLVDLLNAVQVTTPGDLILVANVGEEGLGNLRGAWAAVDRLGDECGAVIAVEGHMLGRITNVAVGSKRIRVMVTGPGGHSWGAFGQPSAIHELGEIITGIARLEVPTNPKTTFNVGVIEGGVSVNTIAPRASAVIDMRSVDAAALADLAADVEAIVEQRRSEQIGIEIEVLGERPAGRTPDDAPIVRTAMAILSRLGFDAERTASSTDANVPIARGIPAICVGLTFGGAVHRVDEWIEIEPIAAGMAQLAMLASELPAET